jgi:hypothetical protein
MSDHTITLSYTRRPIVYPIFNDVYDGQDEFVLQQLLAVCLTYDEARTFCRDVHSGDIEVWEVGKLKGNGGWAIESEDNARHLTNITEVEHQLPVLGHQENP